MNREVALNYLKKYELIHPKLCNFSRGWREIAGDMNALDYFHQLEDMLVSILEEILGLDEETLWDYFVTKDIGGKIFVKDQGDRIEIEDVEHLVSVLESKKEKGES